MNYWRADTLRDLSKLSDSVSICTSAPDVLWPPAAWDLCLFARAAGASFVFVSGELEVLKMYVLLVTALNQWLMSEGSKLNTPACPPSSRHSECTPLSCQSPVIGLRQRHSLRTWLLPHPHLPLFISLPTTLSVFLAALPNKSPKTLPPDVFLGNTT